MSPLPRHLNRSALLERAQRFINTQPDGAGTWPDGTHYKIPETPSLWIKVIDKVGRQAPERWIEVHRTDDWIGTLVYDHHTRAFVRSFSS
jgi:hypothetical protein